MSDRAGPKSSSSDFEWPEWHQGQDGGETRRSATASAPPSDASADSDPGEPEQGTYAPSDKPPPVIEAFPEQTNHYEPPPEPDDEPRDIPWPLTVTIIAACIAVVALIAVLVGIITNRGDSSGPSTAQSTTSPSATTSPPVTVTSEETQTQKLSLSPRRCLRRLHRPTTPRLGAVFSSFSSRCAVITMLSCGARRVLTAGCRSSARKSSAPSLMASPTVTTTFWRTTTNLSGNIPGLGCCGRVTGRPSASLTIGSPSLTSPLPLQTMRSAGVAQMSAPTTTTATPN